MVVGKEWFFQQLREVLDPESIRTVIETFLSKIEVLHEDDEFDEFDVTSIEDWDNVSDNQMMLLNKRDILRWYQTRQFGFDKKPRERLILILDNEIALLKDIAKNTAFIAKLKRKKRIMEVVNADVNMRAGFNIVDQLYYWLKGRAFKESELLELLIKQKYYVSHNQLRRVQSLYALELELLGKFSENLERAVEEVPMHLKQAAADIGYERAEAEKASVEKARTAVEEAHAQERRKVLDQMSGFQLTFEVARQALKTGVRGIARIGRIAVLGLALVGWSGIYASAFGGEYKPTAAQQEKAEKDVVRYFDYLYETTIKDARNTKKDTEAFLKIAGIPDNLVKLGQSALANADKALELAARAKAEKEAFPKIVGVRRGSSYSDTASKYMRELKTELDKLIKEERTDMEIDFDAISAYVYFLKHGKYPSGYTPKEKKEFSVSELAEKVGRQEQSEQIENMLRGPTGRAKSVKNTAENLKKRGKISDQTYNQVIGHANKALQLAKQAEQETDSERQKALVRQANVESWEAVVPLNPRYAQSLAQAKAEAGMESTTLGEKESQKETAETKKELLTREELDEWLKDEKTGDFMPKLGLAATYKKHNLAVSRQNIESGVLGLKKNIDGLKKIRKRFESNVQSVTGKPVREGLKLLKAKEILRIMQVSLRQNLIQCVDVAMLFIPSFDDGIFDCDLATLNILDLAFEYDLPIYPATSEKHIFALFDDGVHNPIIIEGTRIFGSNPTGKTHTDENNFYDEAEFLKRSKLRGEYIPKEKTPPEIIDALAYREIGTELHAKYGLPKKMKKVKYLNNKALKYAYGDITLGARVAQEPLRVEC